MLICVGTVYAHQTTLEKYIVAYNNQRGLCPYPTNAKIKSKLQQDYLTYKKLAKQGNVEARYIVAAANYYSLGVNNKLQQAYQQFLALSKQGVVKAMRLLASILLNGGIDAGNHTSNKLLEENIQQGLSWYKKAAANGDVQSLIALSGIYHQGIVAIKMPSNDNKAFSYAVKAAQKNNGLSFLNLGDFYYSGIGVKKSYQEALNLYLKGVDSENIGYFYRKFYYQKIAMMYSQGLGVNENPEKAGYWRQRLDALKNEQYCPYRV